MSRVERKRVGAGGEVVEVVGAGGSEEEEDFEAMV